MSHGEVDRTPCWAHWWSFHRHQRPDCRCRCKSGNGLNPNSTCCSSGGHRRAGTFSAPHRFKGNTRKVHLGLLLSRTNPLRDDVRLPDTAIAHSVVINMYTALPNSQRQARLYNTCVCVHRHGPPLPPSAFELPFIGDTLAFIAKGPAKVGRPHHTKLGAIYRYTVNVHLQYLAFVGKSAVGLPPF